MQQLHLNSSGVKLHQSSCHVSGSLIIVIINYLNWKNPIIVAVIVPRNTKTFTIPFPEEYEDKEVAGKECEFTVTLKDVKAKDLAELDDEFAKGIGDGFETVAELREQIKNNLFENANTTAQREYENKIKKKYIIGSCKICNESNTKVCNDICRNCEKGLKGFRYNVDTLKNAMLYLNDNNK